MARIATYSFTDPIPYGAAIRAADIEVVVTAKGSFSAKLMQIDFDRLWMQYGSDNLPRVFRSKLSVSRAIVTFLADGNQAAMQHSGLELSPAAIVAKSLDSLNYHRTWQACRWASLSLPPSDLAAASHALLGREMTAPSVTRLMRPDPAHLARLVNLHAAARKLADAAPDTFSNTEAARSLEQEIVRAMITCLADVGPTDATAAWRHHSAIINRFEDLLAANCDRPMYLPDICAAIGASERTLRICCEEHLGMGPIRYLWLRRMHLARRVLGQADPANATVTQIATDHGFWELGRFAVSYRALFGESPSATLRRPATAIRSRQNRPSALLDSEIA
jgi:AraC-like DNA-binding protein